MGFGNKGLKQGFQVLPLPPSRCITLIKALAFSGPHFLICEMEIMPLISHCVAVRLENADNNSWHRKGQLEKKKKRKGQLMVTVIRVNLPTALLNILQGCIFQLAKGTKLLLVSPMTISKRFHFSNP